MRPCRGCPGGELEDDEDAVCEGCGQLVIDCVCDDFDADELGLDPEDWNRA